MMSNSTCNYYLDENAPGYVVEYRGNFKEQIDKVDYACGDTITDTLAVVAVSEENLDRLRKDVPATKIQKVYLNDLMKYHKIETNVALDLLTRSQASRLTDRIILQYGKMIRGD